MFSNGFFGLQEIESLRSENQRLKDENSSLLKVVSQLSTSSRK